MRLLICAGGTGGGVYPAETVLDALELDKDSVLWVGGRGGIEETLVTRREIPFKAIPAAGVHGVGLKRLPGNIWKLLKGFFASTRILREFNPMSCSSRAGTSLPMAVAALRRPPCSMSLISSPAWPSRPWPGLRIGLPSPRTPPLPIFPIKPS